MNDKLTPLSDKVIFITGAAKGLGRSLALKCADDGANLILCDKELRDLEIIYDEILEKHSHEALLLPVNFEGAIIDDYLNIASRVEERYSAINALIINAASLGELAPIPHYDPLVWARVFQVNIHSAFLLLKHLDPIFEKKKSSNIIFTLAPEVQIAKPFWGAYAVSKKALLGLMELTAKEMEIHSNVKVNGVVPSPMRTDLYRQAYPAADYSQLDKPEKNTSIYLELMSAMSDYPSGVVIKNGE